MTRAEKAIQHTKADGSFLRVTYPFTAIIGNTTAKRALLMLSVDRELRGVLIASKDGSDSSTVARSFAALISEVDLNPTGSKTGDPSDSKVATGIVDLPLNITEDRLLGGLDLDRTIASGKPQVSPGVLAAANGRVLLVHDINLLETSACGHLAGALDRRHIRIEREGVSALHEADFTLVATFNPDEGEPAALLRDRVGLIVDVETKCQDDHSVEIIDRFLRFDENPADFANEFAVETSRLKQEIGSSRARLPFVKIDRDQLSQLSEVAVRLSVEGNRSDGFAVRAARASAALAGRDHVIEDDLIIAIQLVLMPRAISDPEMTPENEEPAETPPPESNRQDSKESKERSDNASDSIPDAIEDLILEALDARISDDLQISEQRAPRALRSGKRLKDSKSFRGRYVRSQIRRSSNSRVAIDATLRAAAPYQPTRRRKLKNLLETEASQRVMHPKPRVRIEPCDLRYKELNHRTGILFIFAVDASGSMALNRISQAKGALTRLLQQAYLHRDQVALVSFRRDSAEVLLTPTRSVELAKRLTDAIPAGGGTPLAAGIAKALEVARSAKLRGMPQAMIVLFTDGRANVRFGRSPGLGMEAIADELRQVGIVLHKEDIKTVVVDTKAKHVGGEEGKALAELLGARYLSLSRSDPKLIYNAITSAVGRLDV
ncbi:MAG TPA: magnesium chelatase ATPase subunit D [Blastocatellia bacterium]|nr:magnesium chelatase ATPase subunit D [Blastocatellia bacterium]